MFLRLKAAVALLALALILALPARAQVTLVSADMAGQTAGADLSTVTWPTGGAFTASAVTSANGQLVFSGSTPSTARGNTASVMQYYSATVAPTGTYDVYGCFFIASTTATQLTGLVGHIQSITGTDDNAVELDINPAGGTSAAIRFYGHEAGALIGPNAGGLDSTTVTISGGQYICLHLWFDTGGTVAHAAYSLNTGKVLPSNLPSQTYTNVTNPNFTLPTTTVDLTPAGRFGVNGFGTEADGTGAQIATFLATKPSVAGVTVAVTDANVYWSPFNWLSLSGGAMTSMQSNNVRGGATSVRTNNPGAYCKFAFDEPASGILNITFSSASLSGASVTATSWPILKYSVDNAAFQTHQIASSDSGVFTLATGLSAGTHTVLLSLMSSDSTIDRWTTPVEVLTVTGFQLATGSTGTVSSVGTDVAPFSNKMLIFGDSELEGLQTLSDAYPALSGADSMLTFAISCASALQCEYGIVGYGEAGYNGPTVSGSNVPIFASFWLKYDNADARDTSIVPKYVFEALGTNGTTSQAQVTAWLTAMRGVWPASGGTYLFPVTIPTLSSANNATLAATKAASVSAWNSGNPAADKVYAIAVPWENGQAAYHSGVFPTRTSFDGLHMSAATSLRIGGYIAGQALKLTSASGGGRRRIQ